MTKQAKVEKPRIDVYEEITTKIINALEKGTRPWHQPWSVKRPTRFNGEPYTGINSILLWIAAEEKQYTSSTWMTYKQAEALKSNVRKGEKSTLVVYADKFIPKNEKDDPDAKPIFFMKGYRVFNADQIDGLPEKFYEKTNTTRNNPIPTAESFFSGIGATLISGGNRACYAPSRDVIAMPNMARFRNSESYYATLAHEHLHWTGHTTRLNRDLSGRFGEDAFAMEELVAEIGAAFICSDIGIQTQIEEDHAAYTASWIKVLREDKKAIVTAARKAQDAADFLNKSQSEELAEAA